MRALAIAFFFAIGTAIGGVAAPWLFGALIGSGSRHEPLYGYLAGAGLMNGSGRHGSLFGVKAERQSLENLAAPFHAEESDGSQLRSPA